MQSFGEFLRHELKSVQTHEFLAAASGSAGTSILDILLEGTVKIQDAERFALAMLDYLRGDSFLREVDKRIGEPDSSRPTKEFLEIAKKQLKDLIEEKFGA